MQLRIVDRPAFLVDAIGTEATVRVHHRLIARCRAHSAAATKRLAYRPDQSADHWSPRRPRSCPFARASGRHGRDRRQECGREGQVRHNLVLCCHVSTLFSVQKIGECSQSITSDGCSLHLLWRRRFDVRLIVSDSFRSAAFFVNPQTREVAEREAD